jgi:hypothetical protein
MTLQKKDVSCLVKFSERPGVYVSNADAIVWAKDLRHLLSFHTDAPPTCLMKIEELAELLESVK